MNFQAEVQSKSSPTPNSNSKLKTLTPNSNSRMDWSDTIIEQPTLPTLNFSSTSRGPTTKCYTFLESSHYPQPRSHYKRKRKKEKERERKRKKEKERKRKKERERKKVKSTELSLDTIDSRLVLNLLLDTSLINQR